MTVQSIAKAPDMSTSRYTRRCCRRTSRSLRLLREERIACRRDGYNGIVRPVGRCSGDNGGRAERDEFRLQLVVGAERKGAAAALAFGGCTFGAFEFDEPDKLHFLLNVQMDLGHGRTRTPFSCSVFCMACTITRQGSAGPHSSGSLFKGRNPMAR